MDINALLALSIKNSASDLHLSAGLPPMMRIDGDIKNINEIALDDVSVKALIDSVMNDKQRVDYQSLLETDFSFSLSGTGRFRVMIFQFCMSLLSGCAPLI